MLGMTSKVHNLFSTFRFFYVKVDIYWGMNKYPQKGLPPHPSPHPYILSLEKTFNCKLLMSLARRLPIYSACKKKLCASEWVFHFFSSIWWRKYFGCSWIWLPIIWGNSGTVLWQKVSFCENCIYIYSVSECADYIH